MKGKEEDQRGGKRRRRRETEAWGGGGKAEKKKESRAWKGNPMNEEIQRKSTNDDVVPAMALFTKHSKGGVKRRKK